MRRRDRLTPLVLALVLVLSGCFGIVDPGGLDGSPTDDWDGDSDNPWRQETLTVAVEPPSGSDRNVEPLVRRALDYWEANAERYAGYPVQYELVSDTAKADVVVTFVPAVTGCGDDEHTAGCAPIITDHGQINRPERVRVKSGLSDESTVSVLKHEFGHTLGLTHEDEPRSVMRARSNLTTTPQPDAAERPVPWASPTLSVHVSDDAVPADQREATRDQVDAALSYYDRGADGHVPENVSFVEAADRESADVVVSFRNGSCGPGNVSCVRLYWTDPDGDGRPEQYSRVEITVDPSELETDAVAWHVARWLGSGFAFEAESDYPPPLRSDAGYGERRSEWWR